MQSLLPPVTLFYMEEIALFVLWVFAEVIIHSGLYFTGWIVLKTLSLGRVALEPKRAQWNEKEDQFDDYNFSDSSICVIGLITWICVGITLAAKYGSG